MAGLACIAVLTFAPLIVHSQDALQLVSVNSTVLNGFSTQWDYRYAALSGPSSTVARADTFIELADGLNYLDPSGQWQRSREEFVPQHGGFSAHLGPQKLFLDTNLNRPAAVEITTEDGVTLRCAPLALLYFDPLTGHSVLLAKVQNAFARHTAPNVVTYPNAFKELHASVRYVYQKGGIHQDIILHEAPPPPATLGLSDQVRINCGLLLIS